MSDDRMSLGLTAGMAVAPAVVALSAAVTAVAIIALIDLSIGNFTVIAIVGDITSNVFTTAITASIFLIVGNSTIITVIGDVTNRVGAAAAAAIVFIAAVCSLQELAAGYDCTKNRSVSTGRCDSERSRYSLVQRLWLSAFATDTTDAVGLLPIQLHEQVCIIRLASLVRCRDGSRALLASTHTPDRGLQGDCLNVGVIAVRPKVTGMLE